MAEDKELASRTNISSVMEESPQRSGRSLWYSRRVLLYLPSLALCNELAHLHSMV